MPFNNRRNAIVVLIVGMLCGCSSQTGSTGVPPGGNATQPGAASSSPGGSTSSATASNTSQLQVDSSGTKNGGGSSANWGADKDTQSKPRFQRGALLSGGGGGGAPGGGGSGAPAPQVDPWAARYPKWRLDKAATVRSWAHVSVVPVGIDAFIKTAWTQGQLHTRLALLGPLKNLHEFSRTQNSLKVTFQDRAGNALYTFIVPMDQMQEAPNSTNFGTPTYVVEGSMELPLEAYEEFYQWAFEWN